MREQTSLPPGHATLEIAAVAGASRVVRAHAASPLRLLCPDVSPRAAWAFTSSFGGGLVDGDSLSLDVTVGRDARLLLLSQASTKVYRGKASQRLSLRVGGGALLVSAVDPVVCFAGASYTQSIEATLDEGASCVILDAYTAGRSERGERWAFDLYESRVTITRSDGSGLVDAVTLDPAHGPIEARMDRFQAFATLFLAGPQTVDHATSIVEELAATPAVPGAPVVMVASAHRSGTTIVRIGAIDAASATARARSLCRFVTPLVGEDPWARRP